MNKLYSVWISTKPVSDSLSDEDFMFIGSSNALPMNISYNSSTMGILGEHPSEAIFVDGVGGAVMNLTINADRVNPINYKGKISEESPPPSKPRFGDMYRVDGGAVKSNVTIGETSYMHGVFVAWSGEKWCNPDSNPNMYSNKKFMEELLRMRIKIQTQQSAYVLRIYNISQISRSTLMAGGSELHNKRESLYGEKAIPKDMYIYLNTFDIGLSVESPNEITVSMNLIQRNKLRGYNE